MHHKSIIKLFILFIASLGIIIILFLGGMIYINNNLSTYFIYYVKHLPHAKNTYPEMVMILDNLDSIDDPNIKGLRYDTDGNNSIINGEGTILTQAPDSNSIQYALIPKGTPQENYRTYYFSDNGKFYTYYYQRPDKGKDIYDDSEERQREAQHYIDEIITPIVNKLEDKPRVDLQWFFNKKYQERFSRD